MKHKQVVGKHHVDSLPTTRVKFANYAWIVDC